MGLSRNTDLINGRPSQGRRLSIPRFGSKEAADKWKRAHGISVTGISKLKSVPLKLTLHRPTIKPEFRIATREAEPEEMPWKEREFWGLKNPMALGVYGGGGLLLIGGTAWLLMRKKKGRR